MTPSLPSGDKERWYYGYRWRERREMTDGERELLAKVRTEAQRRRRIDLTRSLAVLGLGLAILAFTLPRLNPETNLAFVITGVIAIFFGVFGILSGEGRGRGAIRDIDLDEQAGLVDEFELLIPADPIWASLGQVLVTTGGSQRILNQDISRYRRIARAVTPASPQLCNDSDSKTRQLSEDEAGEARKLALGPAPVPVMVGTFALIEMSGLFLPQTREDPVQVLVNVALLLIFAAIMAIPAVGRYRLLRAARGCIEVEKRVFQGKEGEVIPGTNLPWTVRGFPAAWRRRPADGFFTVAIDEASWKLG